MSNVDHYLKDVGFFVILDFDNGNQVRVTYKHNNKMKTYKNDYSKILLSLGHYHLVRKDSYSHPSRVSKIRYSFIYKLTDEIQNN